MLGAAIASGAIGTARRRILASEQTGPRPAGVGKTDRADVEPRETRARRP